MSLFSKIIIKEQLFFSEKEKYSLKFYEGEKL